MKRLVQRLMAAQARRPTGLLGRLVGRGMARSNVESNRWVVEQLPLRPDSRVLEVGFGPGDGLAEAARRAPEGRVTGIDFSPLMVAEASRRNAAAIAAGRMVLHEGDAYQTPFEEQGFDVAYLVNLIYVISEPERLAAELARIVVPGGTVAIYFAPHEQMRRMGFDRSPLFTLRSPAEVAQAFATRALEERAVLSHDGGAGTGHLLLLQRAPR